MWIARDKNGLFAFKNEPIFFTHLEEFGCMMGEEYCELPSNWFPEITLENSPKKVELKLATTGADRSRRDSIIRGLKQLEKDYMLSYEEEIEWLNQLVKDYVVS